MLEWIPLTEGKPESDKIYWITDGEYRSLAYTYNGGLSINEWNHIQGSQLVNDLSFDGVEDFELMKRVTHYAEFKPISLPILPMSPIKLNVNIDEDVSDIRQERICENCKHYREQNDSTNWGKCSKLCTDAHGTIMIEKPSAYSADAFVYGWFGCNQWHTREMEITGYSMENDGFRMHQIIKALYELDEKYKHIDYFYVKMHNRVIEFLIDGKAVININVSGMLPHVIIVGCNFILGAKINTAFNYLFELLQELEEIHQ